MSLFQKYNELLSEPQLLVNGLSIKVMSPWWEVVEISASVGYGVDFESPATGYSQFRIFMRPDEVDKLIDRLKIAKEALVAKKSLKDMVFDFNESLGETVMEKFESLYVKIVEISAKLTAFGASPESITLTIPSGIVDFFTGCYGFQRNESNVVCMNDVGDQYLGTLNRRWVVYHNVKMSDDKMIIGSDVPYIEDVTLTLKNCII